MRIRGAPLIAIVAVLGLAVDLTSNEKTIQELAATDDVVLKAYVYTKMEYLKTSRPTAVNLFNAIAELRDIVEKAPESCDKIIDAIVTHAVSLISSLAKWQSVPPTHLDFL